MSELKKLIFERGKGFDIPEVRGWPLILQYLDLCFSKMVQAKVPKVILQTKNKGSGAYESYGLSIDVEFEDLLSFEKSLISVGSDFKFSAKGLNSLEFQKLSECWTESPIYERRELGTVREESLGLFESFVQIDVNGVWLYKPFDLSFIKDSVTLGDLVQYKVLLVQLLENAANQNVPETLNYIQNQRVFYLIRYREFIFNIFIQCFNLNVGDGIYKDFNS